MLREITDSKGRCACYVDDLIGTIEHEYRKVKTVTILPVGGEYVIKRDTTVTILRRVDSRRFEVDKTESVA